MSAQSEFARSFLDGLKAEPKIAQPKWLYDERGSMLFEQICETDEYYQTRTEFEILKRAAPQIATLLGPDVIIVEPGAGAVAKIRLLLDALDRPRAYVPQDISSDHLEASAATLRSEYPDLAIVPTSGDFTQPIDLPPEIKATDNLAIFFPGSTIGNFEPHEALELFERFALVPYARHLILGADLCRDEAVLLRAYDDSEGITADFNLNLLARANRELGADFDLDAFKHQVRYNRDSHRVEMHLESKIDQSVNVLGEAIAFRAAETIHTENSYKYDEAGLADITEPVGWSVRQKWTDEHARFGLFLFVRS